MQVRLDQPLALGKVQVLFVLQPLVEDVFLGLVLIFNRFILCPAHLGLLLLPRRALNVPNKLRVIKLIF